MVVKWFTSSSSPPWQISHVVHEGKALLRMHENITLSHTRRSLNEGAHLIAATAHLFNLFGCWDKYEIPIVFLDKLCTDDHLISRI